MKKRDKSSSVLKTLAQYMLLGLYQATFGLYVRFHYRLKRVLHSPIPRKGPFFLLGNHTNNFDGLFLQCLFSRPIRFVVTESVFKNKTLSRLLYLVDYIPKRKSVSDPAAMRQIIEVAQRGGIVGIFPEGARSWDGVTGPIAPATFRMIEMLKIPVVTANLCGSYLSDPRWANSKRHGRVEVHLQTIIEADSGLSLSEITKKIITALAHNEHDWQREARIPFRGRALCSGLERLMFICPVCETPGTVTSSKHDAWCTACHARFSLDRFGFLSSDSGALPADSLDKINEWQTSRLQAQFGAHPETPRLMADESGVLLCAETRQDSFHVIDTGKAILTRNQIIIGRYSFDLSDITGINVYFKSHLEFQYRSADYRIGFDNPHISAYKWQRSVELARERITSVG